VEEFLEERELTVENLLEGLDGICNLIEAAKNELGTRDLNVIKQYRYIQRILAAITENCAVNVVQIEKFLFSLDGRQN